MKWISDIATKLIEGTTRTQKFIILLLIIISMVMFFFYREHNETEVEIHKIHRHLVDIDTVYLPAPSKPGDHHWDILKTGNTRLPSKSKERIAAKG